MADTKDIERIFGCTCGSRSHDFADHTRDCSFKKVGFMAGFTNGAKGYEDWRTTQERLASWGLPYCDCYGFGSKHDNDCPMSRPKRYPIKTILEMNGLEAGKRLNSNLSLVLTIAVIVLIIILIVTWAN